MPRSRSCRSERETTFFGLLDEPLRLQVADVNVAILVLFAIASMSVYGIVLAGWSSNSKYSLLGGLRSSAQMISYELSYGLALAGVLLLANSLSLTDVVDRQAGAWFHVIPRWNVFLQPIGFVVFMIAGIAETNRAPFDFPEAEQELVAGYHTEYSSMSFAMFFLAEYINMVTVSAVATDLFLGGWHGPFLPESMGWIWFLVKVGAILFFYVWMRWTLPRYRYDQLMAFGWKILLPDRGGEPDRDRRRSPVLWTVTIDVIPFYLFGAIAVGASLLVIAQRSPIYSVLLLIASFGALSGLYVLLDAPFVAVIQIIVYAGAIMVLFLFVVMLLNAPHEETEEDLAREAGPARDRRRAGLKVFGAVLAALFVVELVWALTRRGGESGAFGGASVTSVAAIGRSLFTDYAFAFEVTSVLILVAMVGAVVLAHREPAGGNAHWGEGAPRSGPPE